MINDAPSALLGLNEADIHRVLEEKITFALDNLALPEVFRAKERLSVTTKQEKELVEAFIGGLCNPPAESDEADITNLTVDIDHYTALLLRKISSETGQPLQDLLNEAFELGLTAKAFADQKKELLQVFS